ncbi:AAA family ATPase [Metasolibacillus sp.]|uniref:AAA family ATPase n=1 Tax=Metasolibacillus sp. TaxID=2703680 RepID=UPI0025D6E7A1|nr:AAA family ATPase [Metasolibacillus sp.]MCT6925702.1 ATP-binding protein [Metasolibacillus sp.]MCT6941858.1 ATP-binding protein [Metasolibacillus sp.]
MIKIQRVTIRHLKNVKHGSFQTNTTQEKANVVGFYGQNGSGKTAVVEAFHLLKILLQAKTLPDNEQRLIYFEEKSIELHIEFFIINQFGEYYVKYFVELQEGMKTLKVCREALFYKENKRGKRYKELVAKDGNDISIRNKKMQSFSESQRVNIMVANYLAEENATSFIFRKELVLSCSEEEKELLQNLRVDFNNDFHVIDTIHYGLLVANLVMPLSIHTDGIRGNIPYELRDTMLLPRDMFATIEKVITQTNIVLTTIIPGLVIKVREIHREKMPSGEDGVRFEFLSVKGEIELPLRSESQGVLKIISILSTLIAVYNNPNACVVIDELDAGIFEYLLGEILEVIHDNGKGQLFFTSHNLRILEVLPVQNLWFTTLNEEERYLQLKGVRKLSNARDVYLRAIQLGGQEEAIYNETNLYDIKKSFRKAGKVID